MDNIPPDKAAIRASLLRQRADLPKAAVSGKSARILAFLRALPQWRSATEILLYLPIKNEVDTTPLLDELWSRGVRTLLPRCRPDEPGVMDVACVTCTDELTPGKYGIPEPAPEVCPGLFACAPDVVLIPGVGFDRQGHRLGFGAGFYDRYLAGDCAKNSLRFGLGYSFQVVDSLPADSWDIPMHAIITEDGILWT